MVSVGVDHDTAAFAVNSIRPSGGRPSAGALPQRHSIADHRRACPAKAGGGGSNGSRVRLWKRELQKLAKNSASTSWSNPCRPGTSKWNKIEHRLFSSSAKTGGCQATRQHRVIVEG